MIRINLIPQEEIQRTAGRRQSMALGLLVASGTVGPLAMIDGSSPGTSLMVSVTTCAGAQAAASRPPLMRDRCLRTQFISVMLAPESSSSRLMRCFSCSPRPSAGKVSSAEPTWKLTQRSLSWTSEKPITSR